MTLEDRLDEYRQARAAASAAMGLPDPFEETPAEELGALRRELSEHDSETPEHRDILDRIAVLTAEAAVARKTNATRGAISDKYLRGVE